MLVVDKTLVAGVVICSLMVGIGSFGRSGMFAGSPSGEAGILDASATLFLGGARVASKSGGGAMGNLKSDSATTGDLGEGVEPMAGVFGPVDAPEGRLNGEPRSGGYEALYRGDVGVLKGRCCWEAIENQRRDSKRLDWRAYHQPYRGPDIGDPRETTCILADRPWPRAGRETVEPALLVAWLSTELTEPIETTDTDLAWL